MLGGDKEGPLTTLETWWPREPAALPCLPLLRPVPCFLAGPHCPPLMHTALGLQFLRVLVRRRQGHQLIDLGGAQLGGADDEEGPFVCVRKGKDRRGGGRAGRQPQPGPQGARSPDPRPRVGTTAGHSWPPEARRGTYRRARGSSGPSGPPHGGSHSPCPASHSLPPTLPEAGGPRLEL